MIIKTFCRILCNESVESLTFNTSKNFQSRVLFQDAKIWKQSNPKSTTKLFSSSSKFLNGKNEDNIVRSSFPDVKVPNVPFSKFIWDDNAQLRGKNVALVSFLNYFKSYRLLVSSHHGFLTQKM